MEPRADSVQPPHLERERFLFRISQIAALALILAVSAITFALINFVGLNPVIGDLERRVAELERARAMRFYEDMRVRSGLDGESDRTVEEALEVLDGASGHLDPGARARMEELRREMEQILGSPLEGDVGEAAEPE